MLKMARIVATHPESHSVDVVIMEDGRRIGGVQVLSHMGGGNVGHVDLPEPTVTDPSKPYESKNTGVRDIYALVAFVSRDIPVVVGFIYPQITQTAFEAKNFRINRHASDVYSTLDESGNYEWVHPSGTFIKVGETMDHTDLTGTDYDAKWKIENNTDKLANIRIHVGNSGSVKSTIDIDSNGNISITNIGTTTINSTGDMTLQTGGNMAITASGDVNVTGANINLN